MSWGQGGSYVRIKPPLILIYYSYRFLRAGRGYGWDELGAAVVYYYTLRLRRNDLLRCGCGVYYIYCGCV